MRFEVKEITILAGRIKKIAGSPKPVKEKKHLLLS
jgi:hypothetical protein